MEQIETGHCKNMKKIFFHMKLSAFLSEKIFLKQPYKEIVINTLSQLKRSTGT
jgi:hypothetical protein